MSPERADTGGPLPRHTPSGVFVAVVGPSGAGKDTLMSRAARHPALDPHVRFARRIVTRAVLVASEDHDSLDEAAFMDAEADGAFCLTWAAHGLRYALPRSVVADLDHGRTVVANLSRRSLGDAVRAFGTLQVVEVTARPEILVERILARGRESQANLQDRLRRQVSLILPPGTSGHLQIDNSGDVETATELFVRHLDRLRRPPGSGVNGRNGGF